MLVAMWEFSHNTIQISYINIRHASFILTIVICKIHG